MLGASVAVVDGSRVCPVCDVSTSGEQVTAPATSDDVCTDTDCGKDVSTDLSALLLACEVSSSASADPLAVPSTSDDGCTEKVDGRKFVSREWLVREETSLTISTDIF